MENFVHGKVAPAEPEKRATKPKSNVKKKQNSRAQERAADRQNAAVHTTQARQESAKEDEAVERDNHDMFHTDLESNGDTATLNSMHLNQSHQFEGRQQDFRGLNGYEMDFSTKAVQVDHENEDDLAESLHSQYPNNFESPEHALNAIRANQVIMGLDGSFSWVPGAESYPTTTSGRMEEEQLEGKADSVEDDARHTITPSKHGENQRYLHFGQMQYLSQSKPPVVAKFTGQPTVGDRFPATIPHLGNEKGQDVYNQMRDRAGPPRPRTTQPDTRPKTAVTFTNEEPRPATRGTVEKMRTHHPKPLQQNRAPMDSGQASDRNALDFDPPALYEKPYITLKRMPFDQDPRRTGSVLPNEYQSKPLSERLGIVRTFTEGQQAEFFTNLPLDEWEDAGDWFVNEFAAILKRMKDARREKRNLALEFEDRVALRHEAVAKKRGVVDTALKDMRKSGNAVLAGTPRKGR